MISLRRKSIRVRVAGMVVIDGKMLFVSHKKDNREYWLIPGGGVEFGESVDDALRREMKEELGIDIAIKDLVFSCDSIDPSGTRHMLNLFFLCEKTGGNIVLGDDPRLSSFACFSEEEIPHLTIFPPCSKQIIHVLKGEKQPVYQGSVWEK